MDHFDSYGFNRVEIGNLLGINLFDDESTFLLAKNLLTPGWLKPYKSRTFISLLEASYLIMGIEPFSNLDNEARSLQFRYADSLWDAVDSKAIGASNIEFEEYGNDSSRRNCTLVKKEVEEWTAQHGFDWPLRVDTSFPSVKSQDSEHLTWGEFNGKNTALMMIAGMALALAKSSPSFRNGSKMNKAAIAGGIQKNLSFHGFKGVVVTSKQMTNLIKEALEMCFPSE